MLGLIQYARAYVRTAMKSDRGATMVEYGLMVALIAVVVALAAEALGGAISGLFTSVAGQL